MEHSAHTLVTDVTPWWWSTHHTHQRAELAADVMTDVFDAEPGIHSFTIRLDRIEVEVAIGDRDDVSKLQSFTDGIREQLDALVDSGS